MISRRNLASAAVIVLITGSGVLAIVLGRDRGPSGALARARFQPSSAQTGTASPQITATPTTSLVPSAQPTASKAPASSASPAPTPGTYVPYFSTLPPGSVLPSDAQCAREVGNSSWEPRPQNRSANHTNVYTQGFRLHNSYLASYGPGYENRVTGNFTGTTDQILRWGACKWGFDENTVRAQAVIESYWQQSTLGDCNGQPSQPATHGCESVGILQVKGANIPPTHPGTWPAAWTSTAFNVDYTLAVRRLCFDGKETWLRQFNPSYAAGDLWGCVGRWFSGRWHDAAADQYIQKVQAIYATKPWATWH